VQGGANKLAPEDSALLDVRNALNAENAAIRQSKSMPGPVHPGDGTAGTGSAS
jgi:hypothetical protein